MRGIRQLGVVVLVSLGLVLAFASAGIPVAAHEHKIVGQYEFIVGWRNEPATAGLLNGLDLGIERHFANNTTAWVVGVETNLTAVLSTGTASVTKAVTPQAGRPGWYTFDVILTRTGTYMVRVTGALDRTAIDISVVLDDVAAASEIQFPVPDPTPTELQDRLNQANAQIATLQSQATLALTLGIAGVVLAAIVGGGSLWLGRKGKEP